MLRDVQSNERQPVTSTLLRLVIHSALFGFLGLNFGWGIINLILSSKLAEYRIDDVSNDGGMGRDWASLGARFTSDNYSAPGKRLLPWVLASTIAQPVVLFVWIFFIAE